MEFVWHSHYNLRMSKSNRPADIYLRFLQLAEALRGLQKA
jgi:hypothetical protein